MHPAPPVDQFCDETAAQLAAAAAQLADVAQRAGGLEEALAARGAALATSERERDACGAALAAAQGECAAHSAALAAAESERDARGAALATVTSERDTARGDIARVRQESARQRENTTRATRDAAYFQAQAQAARNECERRGQQLASSLAAALPGPGPQVAQLGAQVAQLQAQLSVATQIAVDLQGERDALQRSYQLLSQLSNIAAARLAALAPGQGRP